MFSVGKYQTKFYHDGDDTYSSSIGGIVTIVCGFILFFYSFSIFKAAIYKLNYNLDN